MLRRQRALAPLVALALGSACGGEGATLDAAVDAAPDGAAPRDAAAVDAARPIDLSAVADLAPGAYPAGPYGHAIGDVAPPLAWEGYVDLLGADVATKEPYGSTSLDALRRTGRRYGMVHVAEFF